ncbi:MAG: copper chaperone PCu(A)C, partial [Roseovarius sp.]
MSFTPKLLAACTAVTIVLSGFNAAAFAGEGIEVHDAYARSSNPKAGAAFMMIHNHGETDDRLVGVSSDVAKLVHLHTHVEDENGVMKMMHVEDGFDLPAGGMVELKRGGNHVMFMGLADPFEQGETVPVTLIFENAGEVAVDVAIDHDRKAKHMDGHDHSEGHDHST